MDLSTLTFLLQRATEFLPTVLFTAVAGLALWCTIRLVAYGLDFRRLRNQQYVWLELTPPASSDKSPSATQQLFTVLHGLHGSRSIKEKLLRERVSFSLEFASSREAGIRYRMRVPEKEVASFERTIISYLPDVKVTRKADSTAGWEEGVKPRIIEFKQSGYFAYPLHTQIELWQQDPMAYLTGTMTKLAPGEFMEIQLVISPTRVRQAGAIAKRLLRNEELIYDLGRRRFGLASNIIGGLASLFFHILDGIGDVAFGGPSSRPKHSPHELHRQQVSMNIKPARVLGIFEQKLAETVQLKLDQPLFRVSVRAAVVATSRRDELQRIRDIKDWAASFSVQKYQSLPARYDFPVPFLKSFRQWKFKHRLPSLIPSADMLLSGAEVGDMYHFPYGNTTKTENIVKSLSKVLPATVAIKRHADANAFGLVLGRNYHHGSSTDIGLTPAERERHIYIIGGTGNGKTTMMEYCMVQDIRNGKGVALVDPHGDFSEKVLRYVPEDRIDDVVYFNPDDLAYPVAFNLLELPSGLTGDELLREKDLVTESVVSVFRKIFSDDGTGGHRIEYVLRNAVQTALTVEGATLFTVYNLLNDPKYRKSVIRTLDNKDLINFWKNEVGKAGDMQQVKMAAGVTAKIGRFLFSASAKRVLEQPKSTIDFDDILNSGKILICNLSKGLLGEDTSELFGVSILAKLQLAALRRARQAQADRSPFYIYVDEFQNFATVSFIQLLSEARKYKVFLTMAEQSTSQQDDQQMVNTILANVGTVVCFRSGNPADEALLLPLFKPYIEEGEISNLPTYNFYARISAVLSQEPVSGETILLDQSGSESTAKAVVEASRKNYARLYKSVDSTASKSVGGSQKRKTPTRRQATALPGD